MNKDLNTDFMSMVNEHAKENSLKSRKVEVKGECYPSRNIAKKLNKETAKNVILASAAVLALGIGMKAYGDFEAAGDIKEEVNTTYTQMNPIGGKYHDVTKYDSDFVEYANGLGYFELKDLYDETKESMENSMGEIELEDVVEKMEDNYLEEKGMGR